MADTNALLAAIIKSLATAVGNITPAPAPAAARAPHRNAFTRALEFYLSTRAGSTAYDAMSTPLEKLWDGSVQKFPNFIISLQLRANKVKKGETGTSEILLVSTNICITDYRIITGKQIANTYNAHNDDRAS